MDIPFKGKQAGQMYIGEAHLGMEEMMEAVRAAQRLLKEGVYLNVKVTGDKKECTQFGNDVVLVATVFSKFASAMEKGMPIDVGGAPRFTALHVVTNSLAASPQAGADEEQVLLRIRNVLAVVYGGAPIDNLSPEVQNLLKHWQKAGAQGEGGQAKVGDEVWVRATVQRDSDEKSVSLLVGGVDVWMNKADVLASPPSGEPGHPSDYEGHGKPCYYCKEPCNDLAGNPSKWSLAFPHKDEPGVVKWHHTGCVMERLIENQPAALKAYEEGEPRR